MVLLNHCSKHTKRYSAFSSARTISSSPITYRNFFVFRYTNCRCKTNRWTCVATGLEHHSGASCLAHDARSMWGCWGNVHAK